MSIQVRQTVAGGSTVQVRAFRVCRIDVRPTDRRPYSTQVVTTPFRIGSHAQNDLVLADETVSKCHLEIEADPGGYRVRDLSSSNGSFVGSVRISEITVNEPLTIRVGETQLQLTPLDEESEIPAAPEPRFGRLCGASFKMRELFEQLRRVAATDHPALIEGEPGVGKERCAESLHAASARSGQAFVSVDCAAMSSNVVAAELFGHVKGAFTGAEQDRPGLVSLAQNGTLFLDMIDELPITLQARMVALIDRGELMRVGARTAEKIDLRVIAASRTDLACAVNEGRFRGDLFYRLAVARLRVPPLRERPEDLPLLVEDLLTELRAQHGEALPTQLSAVVLARLRAQPWPGNVRELRNVVERAVLAGATEIAESTRAASYSEARRQFANDFTHDALQRALRDANGNGAKAARAMGIEYRYFRRMIAQHRIHSND